MKSMTVVLNLEKETPGTYRYREPKDAEGRLYIGVLYLRKSGVGSPPPDVVKVTVEEAK